MDEKWIFLLIINRDTIDKLCQHLIELRGWFLHLGLHHFNPPNQWQAHKTMASLGRASMVAQNDKGMQTQACMNGAQIHYSLLALISSPPLMHPRGSIYSPSIGSEGSSQSVSRYIWKANSQVIRDSLRKTPKYFLFGHIPRCTWVIVRQVACTSKM